MHEVAVGPVHAGVIEPGHFRFQCHGETVLHLEISLGYQHRGVESASTAGPTIAPCISPRPSRGIPRSATPSRSARPWRPSRPAPSRPSSGDPRHRPRARARGEPRRRPGRARGRRRFPAHRLVVRPHPRRHPEPVRHALRQQVRQGPRAPRRGRIRSGRGARRQLRERTPAAGRDARGACDLLWTTPSVVARFEGTGSLSAETAREIGLVGPAARACGVDRDVRRDHPDGHLPVRAHPGLHVADGRRVRPGPGALARGPALVRLRRGAAAGPPGGELPRARGRLPPTRIAVSLVEGWRGRSATWPDERRSGRFASYKVVDPSFHNWFGLALAMRDGQISDFPLCNKSFNLSYCGHDL